ncbi:MAG: hypothetical protein K2X11_01430 [Acetobacteraceae bacterium]|nr:hypothetical protein [Acetobacteraceae bacterium]
MLRVIGSRSVRAGAVFALSLAVLPRCAAAAEAQANDEIRRRTTAVVFAAARLVREDGTVARLTQQRVIEALMAEAPAFPDAAPLVAVAPDGARILAIPSGSITVRPASSGRAVNLVVSGAEAVVVPYCEDSLRRRGSVPSPPGFTLGGVGIGRTLGAAIANTIRHRPDPPGPDPIPALCRGARHLAFHWLMLGRN